VTLVTDKKSQRQRRRLLTFFAIVFALGVMGVLLARSITPRMFGMGPTGTLPGMDMNSSDNQQGSDTSSEMQGMDMNKTNNDATPSTNP
jgi:hypothetical protein